MALLSLVLTTLLAAAPCYANTGCPSSLPSTPSVTTRHGTLLGGKCNTTDVNFFLSIPYANPPKRFHAPAPYTEVFNKRNATVAAPACPQFGTTFIETGAQSEDCLFLDIWVPEHKPHESKLPVKIWIFGGSNEAGGISNAMYTGCYAAENAIQVNVNYRVGPLGFLAADKAGIGGNFGIQDQLLALKWIKDNIKSFGGDPDKMVLFGQSAGAFNTFAIATMDEAPSLINAAIMESGGGSDFASVAEAQPWNDLFLTGLGCQPSDFSCINSKSVAEMQKAILQMPAGVGPTIGSPISHLGRGFSWGPLVDGKVIPKAPASAGVKVPSVFGSTTSEGMLFVLATYSQNLTKQTQDTYDDFLGYQFGPLASRVNSTYPLSKFPPTASVPNSADAAIGAIYTDYAFKCTTHRGLQKGIANRVPVFAYSFARVPSCTWMTSVPDVPFVHSFLGATHTAELPFVFGVLDGLPAPGGNCSSTADDLQVSKQIISSWDSMAAVASPGAHWPRYSGGSQGSEAMGMLYLANETVVGEIDYSVCSFWDEIREELLALQAHGKVSGP
ncbi:carboxylesterase [Trichoderma gamsii]|uniref:Carboxylic ester hydrolase n=1 Tax=Trichoderma gamsii TaxID=398673 RepID=A0A2P4ZEG7_9HYPO|nr:carboxylesterase [Trichoderma gamsii]PON22685.1 carboxylesterase [Trichoderma gamsii]